MRLGLVSDIHANRVALETVLEDLPCVDELVCVGDVVGYNPWPAACVDLVREHCMATVEGNHDRNVESPETYRHNHMAHAGLELAKAQLNDDQQSWLRTLPRSVTVADGRVLIVHDHPDHQDRYVYPGEFPALRPYLEEYDVIVLGHTHIQAVEHLDEGVVLNPGSVGQPRDGDPRAAYAILDLEATDVGVDLHRVPYDIDAVRDGVRAAGLPDSTGDRLAAGQ